MLEGILQGLIQWVFGLFVDLMSYCSNALLGIMSTDLTFFENNVPVIVDLYQIFVAIGWGLLIGNCAFQAMKAMFAGFGFESESPAILLLRTALFGTLLIFAMDICEIGLSLAKNIIDLLGMPTEFVLTMPDISLFGTFPSAWLLLIIIGFILGWQLLKLLFEVGERYAIVAVLTLLCPVGLAFGGSKSTKEICVGFIRTYASMLVMMVMNVLFLNLMLSAMTTMPADLTILPWCLLVLGIGKAAKKADQIVSKIGLSPVISGDPLGVGRGLMAMVMTARGAIGAAGKGFGDKGTGITSNAASSSSSAFHNSSHHFGNNSSTNVYNTSGGSNAGGTKVGSNHVGGNRTTSGAVHGTSTEQSFNSSQNDQTGQMPGNGNVGNTHSASARFGGGSTVNSCSGKNQFHSSGKKQVNTNRFGSQPVAGKTETSQHTTDIAGGIRRSTNVTSNAHQNTTGVHTVKQNVHNPAARVQQSASNSSAVTQRNTANSFGAAERKQNGKLQRDASGLPRDIKTVPNTAQTASVHNEQHKDGHPRAGFGSCQSASNAQAAQNTAQPKVNNTGPVSAPHNNPAKADNRPMRMQRSDKPANKRDISSKGSHKGSSAKPNQNKPMQSRSNRFGGNFGAYSIRGNFNFSEAHKPNMGVVKPTPESTKNTAVPDDLKRSTPTDVTSVPKEEEKYE